MNESSPNQFSKTDQIIAQAARDLARRRVSEIGREAHKVEGIEPIIAAIESGCNEFNLEDVKNFQRGRKELIEAPKAMYIEAYLKEIERVSKDLNNVLQRKCAEIIAQFPYRLR